MTIKKNLSAPAPEAPAAAPAGGATIADRFKLDLADPSAAKQSRAGASTVIAVVAAVAALAVAGILTFTLYQHWEALNAA